MKINVNEVLEALRTAATPKYPADGFTAAELKEAMGWNFHQGRKALLAFKAAGLIQAGRGRRPAVDDTSRWVPVYRFLDSRKKGT